MNLPDAITILTLYREELREETIDLADRIARFESAQQQANGRDALAELVERSTAIDVLLAQVERR